jgi:hypothetical protein
VSCRPLGLSVHPRAHSSSRAQRWNLPDRRCCSACQPSKDHSCVVAPPDSTSIPRFSLATAVNGQKGILLTDGTVAKTDGRFPLVEGGRFVLLTDSRGTPIGRNGMPIEAPSVAPTAIDSEAGMPEEIQSDDSFTTSTDRTLDTLGTPGQEVAG